MEQCSLCMTDINEGGVVCTGCGAHKEKRMIGPAKWIFLAMFIISFFFTWIPMIGGFLPLGVGIAAVIYHKKCALTHWVQLKSR